ncbi:hypothetical protein [Candidatus Phytoplasma solani]|uniref:hypothetical protein n=1 Tax=Candidatus Phytoplasma solani TaxID=69896 RepID=UPI0003B7DC2D|nr:hypothetical protein [Candidatus Phytoplasma solani]CCP88256.1 conserved hypothetical protein [Candidatus Phytoplasma solani]
MLKPNIYHKNELLRQIIFASFLSYIPVVLAKCFNEISNGISFYAIPAKSYLPYLVFLPLIIMSFYVSKILACMGAFLSETLVFCITTKHKITNYSPIAGLVCVLCFVLLPSCLLKKEDHLLKFYIVILISQFLFQVISWHQVLKYRFGIDLFNYKSPYNDKFINILKVSLLIRLPFLSITSLLVVLILKKLFSRLEQFQNQQKSQNHLNIANV